MSGIKFKQKILYIHHGGELGGAPKSLSILINGLDSTNYEANVFMLMDGPARKLFETLSNNVVVSKVKLFAFHGTIVSGMSFKLFVKNILYFIPNLVAAHKIISKTKPQLIHLNTTCLFAYAIISKVFFKNIKVVCHVREPLLENIHGKILKYFNEKFCDYFIPINELESEPFENSNVTVVKNSINTNQYKFNDVIRQEERDILELNEDHFVIGYFARFNYENGIEDLLNLANNLNSLNQYFKILIYGYEPNILSQDIINIANKMPENVILKGMVNNVNDKMQAIDLLLSPFKKAHFSRSIIEAQSLSIPVIVSNVGSQNTLLINNETGYLYTVGNIKELTEKIVFLKNEKKVLNEMKLKSRNYAIEMFDEKKNNENIYKIYSELLNSKK